MVCDSSAKAGAQRDSSMVSARRMLSSFFMLSVPFVVDSGSAVRVKLFVKKLLFLTRP